ncbi:MAG: TetR/AcrR family transcriptional regulator [Cognatishimia sp.]|uniref:acrylate utilization transcriptional regulator AcuR n=1 Tax=Cognatishimia sp. TaxID=2211648 RepID=UPI003B8B0C72
MTTISLKQTPKRGRPRRDPADAEARQKLIRAGLAYLTEKGYSAVGIDEVLKASGVPKGSFYHYFRNKADYGRVLIEAYNAYFLNKLDRAFTDETLTPLAQLRAFSDDAITGMARHGFRRGCLVGNLGQEMGALPEEFRADLIDVLSQWEARVADCLIRAQSGGELDLSKDPNALAEFFWIGWEGAVLRAKLEHRPDSMTTFIRIFFAHLNS